MKKTIFLFLLLPALMNAAHTIPITIEQATTPEQKARGLMGRKTLPPSHGMLFIYQKPRPLSLWMMHCLIDLSVAFLDHENVITEIRELNAFPEFSEESNVDFFLQQRIQSSKPSQYALEMNANWFADNGVNVGDTLVWRLHSPYACIVRRHK